MVPDQAERLTRELRVRRELALGRAAAGVSKDLHAETTLLVGDPVRVLEHEAAEDLDLLVLGSRGYGPVRRVLLGGVSDDVVRRSPCPVLVVRARDFDPNAGGMAAHDMAAPAPHERATSPRRRHDDDRDRPRAAEPRDAAEGPAHRSKPARADHDRVCATDARGQRQRLGRRPAEEIELDRAAGAGIARKLLEHIASAQRGHRTRTAPRQGTRQRVVERRARGRRPVVAHDLHVTVDGTCGGIPALGARPPVRQDDDRPVGLVQQRETLPSTARPVPKPRDPITISSAPTFAPARRAYGPADPSATRSSAAAVEGGFDVAQQRFAALARALPALVIELVEVVRRRCGDVRDHQSPVGG